METNPRDERVLELLVSTGLALPPRVIYENLRLRGADLSERTVHRRLRVLCEEGLVEKADDTKGYYRATAEGEAAVGTPNAR